MLTLATFNLCNLGADTAPDRLASLAAIVTGDLQGPAILALQEIKALALEGQSIVPADAAYQALIAAIAAAGGPAYAYREVPPLAQQDGGYPQFNIRTGLLFDPRQVEFIDRGQAGPEDPTGIRLTNGRPTLTLSPGRIAPGHPAFSGDSQRHWAPSRKALAAEFRWQGESLFIIACHLKSMRASSRREEDYTKKQRQTQAQVIHSFVAGLLACDSQSRVVVLGDMNDVRGSKTLKILKGDLLSNLLEELPKEQCYTRRHGYRPQALDHILVSPALRRNARVTIPHVNSDFMDGERASDHDPVLAIFNL
ncbi:MAG: endonuclease/exonuclease/phosphatase family protein [Candidatus Competibacteraceae bacterium]